MDGVEAFRLVLRHLDALGSDDAKASVLEHLGDGAGEIAAGGIGLDDRKGARRGHGGHGLLSLGLWNSPQRLAARRASGKAQAFWAQRPSSCAQ
jgi:hypothetical protein